ncbi:MAG: hypothetical protein Q9219_002717 [cf. Caloplaca sp. 3 TL-2023]
MPVTDSPEFICARFLRANNYHETLQTFLAEAGLPAHAGATNPGDLTIEKVLEEKRMFDLNLAFERSDVSVKSQGWSTPGDRYRTYSLPSLANLLHVSVESFGVNPDGQMRQLLFATTADRRLHLLDPKGGFTLCNSLNSLHDSPVLSCKVLDPQNMLTVTASLSGQVILYDHQANQSLDERRDHKKYVVKIDIFRYQQTCWVATAGWDAMIFLYRTSRDAASGTCSLGKPITSLSLATNPETITFLLDPESCTPLLLVTRRDSTFLHYYCWEQTDASASREVKLRLLRSQNLAPHSNAWVSFSPSAVAICPTDPQLLAIATSAVPHMKLIVVRLLIPSRPPPEPEANVNNGPDAQASLARRKLAVEQEEDAAIRVHVSTFAPQTAYSTPQVCWRPDGSGIMVNGDDGVIRGLDAKSGKIMSTLTNGHEPGSKIRSLWVGMVDTAGHKEEWLVSGGFDKKLVVWRVGDMDDRAT